MIDRDKLNALYDELTDRGIDFRKPDVFGFAAEADEHLSVEELADLFEGRV